MPSLNWREKVAAWLLIVIGAIYLGLWLFSTFLHERNLDTSPSSDIITISKDELNYHFRTIITFGTCLLGGIQLLRKKKIGWVLSFIMLIIFTIICGGGLYQAIKTEELGLAGIAGSGILVLLFWLVNLLLPTTRRRLGVGKNEWIRLAVLFAFYSILYFL